MEMLIFFSSRTWYRPTLSKVPVPAGYTSYLIQTRTNQMRNTRTNSPNEQKAAIKAKQPKHFSRPNGLISSMPHCIDATVRANKAQKRYRVQVVNRIWRSCSPGPHLSDKNHM
ncbi:hypothetical protein ILYODFUR_032113 [Ilyodon furcidens]|uniref:Uncharacterized protein n=1 Tax=Ilyodon furcidens TaxID=33524 RepID=A0ABV0TSN9_9TELE